MKIVNVRSMSLPLGVPVSHFDTWKEVVAHFSGDELKAVNVLNLYGRQKDSLVNARDFLSTEVETLGFKALTRIEKKDGKDVTVPAETESKHLDRFVDAAVDGKIKVAGLTVTGTDLKTKTASVWSFLQSIITKHGDFPFDLNSATRVGKPKNPPKYALAYAIQIINNGAKSIAKWAKNFTDGYNSEGYSEKYGPVLPVAFDNFDAKAPAGATPEETEKVRQQNITNLAWAIAAVEQQKADARGGKEYA